MVMTSVALISVFVCRSVAVRLETEVAELRRHLQQAVDHKLEAERQKQVAQDKVNKYTPDASTTASANGTAVFASNDFKPQKLTEQFDQVYHLISLECNYLIHPPVSVLISVVKNVFKEYMIRSIV